MPRPAPCHRARVMAFSVQFELLGTDASTSARRGRIHTPHGTVQTPMFMVVGTQATVKSLGPDDLSSVHAQVLLGGHGEPPPCATIPRGWRRGRPRA